MTGASSQTALSRRKWLGVSIAGALTGAAWATGLGVVARGVHPQIQLIGEDDWQIALMEHGSARLVLLLGHFSTDPGKGIDFLATSLRQKVDVIAGERRNLDLMDWDHPKWKRSTRIVLGEESPAVVSGSEVAPANSLLVSIGGWSLSIVQEVHNAWSRSVEPTWLWVANAACDGMVITFGNDLQIANRHRDVASVLLVAPIVGDMDLMAASPRMSIAVNVASVEGINASEPEDSTLRLVRIFPDDIATFRVTDGRLTIPEWATRR